MTGTVALRYLTHRPWRTMLLLAGFGLGVAVMIVLLAIGEAMLTQARDERLVGGGDVTVLPEGLDVEVMKTGGVGGLFFSIDNARFVNLQLLSSPRLAGVVREVAPQIEDKLLYLRVPGGREVAVRASGELPSASTAVGGAPPVVSGTWRNDELDRRWHSPTPAELRADVDHFHLPPADLDGRETWAEWHYFNVLSHDRRRWAFLSFIVAGAIPDGRWGAQVLLTLHEEGAPARRFSTELPPDSIRFSTFDADVRLGSSSVTVLPDGRYAVRARATRPGEEATVDVIVTPAPYAYFPGVSLGNEGFVSGYAVAALRADAAGSICVRAASARRPGVCERYRGAQAYHDHNWGVWRGVTWEWGAARAGSFTFLYGSVSGPEGATAETPLFFYLSDSLGFRAVFRPRRIAYDDARTVIVDGRPLRVPARATLWDARGADTLRVEIVVEDAAATDTRETTGQGGEALAARRLGKPYFVQMKGVARLSGRVGGAPVGGEGAGFFETYR